MKNASEKRPRYVIFLFFFSLTIPALGYVTLGILPASIFLVGFFGGFVLWLVMPMRAPWRVTRIPYFAALFLFLLHRGVEEQFFGFFPALAEITGVPLPEPTSPVVIVLVALSLVWVLSPLLIKRGHPFGYYGAWSVFFTLGVGELAHFLFPLLTPEPYGYFPGMVTVVFLAPVAWWGMWRLYKYSE